MIVECLSNQTKNLPKEILPRGYGPDDTFEVTIGSAYVVYAMWFFRGTLWYLLLTEGCTYFPQAFPAVFFKVSNPRLSRYWIYKYVVNDVFQQEFDFAYPEWINETYYYSNLVDQEERELNIFREYKAKMDLEFPNSSVTTTGKIIEDDWVMCLNCIDAWQPGTQDGMIICPYCKTLMHNPLYTLK